MARTKNDDKLLDTETISTESEVTDADNVAVSNDESVADTDVDSTATSGDTVVDDASVAEDEDDNAVVSHTDDNTNITDDDDSSVIGATEDETSHSEILEPEVAVIERRVRSTNRLMKVYANANEKSKFHHFVGTYTITGVVKGDFKQIICNVPGIGKFTGYLLSR